MKLHRSFVAMLPFALTLASGNVITHAVADREGGCGLESQFEGGLAVSGADFDGERIIFQSGMQGLGFA